MPKDYTLDTIQNPFGRIKLNYIDGYDTNNSPIYYAARLEWHGKGTNGGAQKHGKEFFNIGTEQNTPFTPKEIYQIIKTEFGNNFAKPLKDLYKNLINDDISV